MRLFTKDAYYVKYPQYLDAFEAAADERPGWLWSTPRLTFAQGLERARAQFRQDGQLDATNEGWLKTQRKTAPTRLHHIFFLFF